MLVPDDVRVHLEGMLVERRSEVEESNVFTLHARKAAGHGVSRPKSAVRLLGQIEAWRLEFRRPSDECAAARRGMPPVTTHGTLQEVAASAQRATGRTHEG